MTVAVLRPNADISSGAGHVNTGGASSDAVTDDDSDATYFDMDGFCEMGFTTVSLPAASVVKQMRTRWRGRGLVGGASNIVNSLLRVPNVGGSHETVVSSNDNLTTTTANYSGTYVTPLTLGASFDGEFGQSQVDGIQVYFEDPTGDGVRVMEAYVDVMYVAQPVTSVSAVTPDPYTASTIVPISWSNTLDSDGGGQTRYQIRVFTDAQYGAGGFDPDTSTPYYDSGQVVSALTSANVGPLEDADTYRAYVRVAQTVNGAPHWSDWAYDQFTMDVVTADVDTVTAVADNATGSITVTVSWDSLTQGWEYIEVERRTVGGTEWHDVRRATYVATPDSGATDFEIVDYEAPNSESVEYRARATYLNTGLPVTGSWVTSSSVSWSSTDRWIKDPIDPTRNITIDFGAVIDQTRSARRGVFEVIGAEFPVVISDITPSPSIEFSIRCLTLADVDSVIGVLSTPRPLLLQTPNDRSFGSQYISVGQFTEKPAARKIVLEPTFIGVSAVVVDSPPDDTAGVM